MNVGLPEVKQDFASIVERITLQPWTMLQFIIWLDLKLAEYKVNGYMVLDQSLSSIPDWLASLKVELPGEDNSPSESVLQEQCMQPTNRRESNMRSNTYRRELAAQSNIIRREVRTQRAFGDRRRDTIAGNQPVPARNTPAPARNLPVPARNTPAPARDPPGPARNQPVPVRKDAISPRRFPSVGPQERRGAGYQRSASPITIDDEEVIVPEQNQPLQQEQRNIMNPGRSSMKRAAMQQPPNAPRQYTDIKHRKVTDTSSPVAPVRSPSSAVTDTSSPVGPARSPSSTNIPRRDLGSDNSHNIMEIPASSEGILSRMVNRPAASAAQSPTLPVHIEQQRQSDIGTVSCGDAILQDPSLSLDIKPIVSETLDDIVSPEATGQPRSEAAPLVDINNFEMPEFLPAQSIGDELFDSASSEPVPTQLFVNNLECRKPAMATSTSATGSDNSSNQPDPVAGTSYEPQSQSVADFDDLGDAQVKMEPSEAEPDDAEGDWRRHSTSRKTITSPDNVVKEDIERNEDVPKWMNTADAPFRDPLRDTSNSTDIERIRNNRTTGDFSICTIILHGNNNVSDMSHDMNTEVKPNIREIAASSDGDAGAANSDKTSDTAGIDDWGMGIMKTFQHYRPERSVTHPGPASLDLNIVRKRAFTSKSDETSSSGCTYKPSMIAGKISCIKSMNTTTSVSSTSTYTMETGLARLPNQYQSSGTALSAIKNMDRPNSPPVDENMGMLNTYVNGSISTPITTGSRAFNDLTIATNEKRTFKDAQSVTKPIAPSTAIKSISDAQTQKVQQNTTALASNALTAGAPKTVADRSNIPTNSMYDDRTFTRIELRLRMPTNIKSAVKVSKPPATIAVAAFPGDHSMLTGAAAISDNTPGESRRVGESKCWIKNKEKTGKPAGVEGAIFIEVEFGSKEPSGLIKVVGTSPGVGPTGTGVGPTGTTTVTTNPTTSIKSMGQITVVTQIDPNAQMQNIVVDLEETVNFKNTVIGKRPKSFTQMSIDASFAVAPPCAWVKCSLCQFATASRAGLYQHQRNIHNLDAEQEAYTCMLCNVRPKTKIRLKEHWHYSHDINCACGMHFTSRSAYRTHMDLYACSAEKKRSTDMNVA